MIVVLRNAPGLIQEAEEPERNLPVMPLGGVAAHVIDIARKTVRLVIADAETLAIDVEAAAAVAGRYIVHGAEVLLEECILQHLLVVESWEDGIEQVGIVQGDACRLLGRHLSLIHI